jgi:hypothetical protein
VKRKDAQAIGELLGRHRRHELCPVRPRNTPHTILGATSWLARYSKKEVGMKSVTRRDQLASLQDIRLGDLPAPLYRLIAELLAQFAEGTLYNADGGGVSQEVLRMFEGQLHEALETVMFKQLPPQMQRLASEWIRQNKMRTDTR